MIIDKQQIINSINNGSTVILLKKDVDRPTAEKIKKLGLREISLDKKTERVYPQDELAAHIIGYYNPDADAGGQFVVMQLSYRLIMDAAEHTDSQIDFYEYLDSCAVIELVDLGTLEFDAILNSYADTHPDFIGRTEENMKQLIMISQAATKECQNEC